jgi:hypothetical protein
MPNPEQGAGWEIIRGFIRDENIIRLAGEQVIRLINGEYPNFCTDVDFNPPGQEGMSVKRLHTWNVSDFPKYEGGSNLSETEGLKEEFHELIMVNRWKQSYELGYVTAPFLHIFEPGGHTRTHRDRTKGENSALSLVGEAVCVITDPVTNVVHEINVFPGDLMYLVNSRHQRLRPKHKVINRSNRIRVSLV